MLLYIGTSLLYLCFSNVHKHLHELHFYFTGISAGVRGTDLHSVLWSVCIKKNKKTEIILFILLVNKSMTVIHEK